MDKESLDIIDPEQIKERALPIRRNSFRLSSLVSAERSADSTVKHQKLDLSPRSHINTAPETKDVR